jgi:glycerol-3-phosphate dehydrogenase
MKKEALKNGVVFLEGQVDQVKCIQETTTVGDPLLKVEELHLRHGKDDNNDVEEIKGIEALVNTTGAWSREFVKETICKQNSSHLSPTQQESILKLLPIERRKRCIFYIHCPGKHEFSHPMPPTNTPLTIDPTGVYFRSEGSTPGHFICGVSPDAHIDEVRRD